MICLNMPIVIVGSFLLLTLVVGIYCSKKEATFREYAVGNNKFSVPILVITFLASTLSGSLIIRFIPNIHYLGLKHIISFIMIPLGIWSMGQIIPRMGVLLTNLSVAETIGSVYGKIPRVIAALSITSFIIGCVSLQIKTIFYAVNMYRNDIPSYTLIISIIIIIFYVSLGGIYAITMTDILQFVTFMTIIMMFAKLVYLETGKSPLEIISFLNSYEKFQLTHIFHYKNLLDLSMYMIEFYILGFSTPLIFIQIAYMASSPKKAKKVFIYSSLCNLFAILIIALIGIFSFTMYTNLPREKVWLHLISSLSPCYKGLFTVCILGMCMSTIDSCLHIAGVTISHDFIENIFGIKHVSGTSKLLIAKCTTIIIGLLATIPAVYHTDILKLSKFVVHLYSVFNHLVAPPLVLIFFGFRGTSRAFLIGMFTCIIIKFIWIVAKIGVSFNFIFFISNILAMMSAHYLFPQPPGKGFVRKYSMDQRARISRKLRFGSRFFTDCSSLNKLTYFRNKFVSLKVRFLRQLQ